MDAEKFNLNKICMLNGGSVQLTTTSMILNPKFKYSQTQDRIVAKPFPLVLTCLMKAFNNLVSRQPNTDGLASISYIYI